MKVRASRVAGLAAMLAVLVIVPSAEAQSRRAPSVAPEQAAKLVEVLKVGEVAKDVEFQPVLSEEKGKLSELAKDGPVVLVVLRGFPGYQCPICSAQVADLRKNADEFNRLGAKVVLVYPGPGPIESLRDKAKEFLADVELPKPFYYMVDPEYAFTNLYELRWDAPRETSFPTTLVLDSNRVVRFRKVSMTHGDRAATKDVLAALAALKSTTGPAAVGSTGPARSEK